MKRYRTFTLILIIYTAIGVVGIGAILGYISMLSRHP